MLATAQTAVGTVFRTIPPPSHGVPLPPPQATGSDGTLADVATTSVRKVR